MERNETLRISRQIVALLEVCVVLDLPFTQRSFINITRRVPVLLSFTIFGPEICGLYRNWAVKELARQSWAFVDGNLPVELSVNS